MRKSLALAVFALVGATVAATPAGAAVSIPTGLKPALTAGGLTDVVCFWTEGHRACIATNYNDRRLRFAFNAGSTVGAKAAANQIDHSLAFRSELRSLARAYTGRSGWRVIRPTQTWRAFVLPYLRRY
jgi:hypothetical protein